MSCDVVWCAVGWREVGWGVFGDGWGEAVGGIRICRILFVRPTRMSDFAMVAWQARCELRAAAEVRNAMLLVRHFEGSGASEGGPQALPPHPSPVACARALARECELPSKAPAFLGLGATADGLSLCPRCHSRLARSPSGRPGVGWPSSREVWRVAARARAALTKGLLVFRLFGILSGVTVCETRRKVHDGQEARR